MMKKIIGYSIVCLLLISCVSSRKGELSEFTLVEKIAFPVDEKTYYFSKSISSFVDENTGNEYFSFENSEKGQHEILFYEMGSQQLVKRIEIQEVGPNAIGMFGHRVKDLNHIYITSSGQHAISLVNDKGAIMQSYNYTQSDEGKPLSLVYAVSYCHMPLIIDTSLLYLPQRVFGNEMSGADWLSTPLCAIMDTLSFNIKILPLKYPVLFKQKSPITSSADVGYSFDFDGENFIYSFMKSDSIIVTSDHIQSRSYISKSRYLNQVKCIPYSGDDIITCQRSMCEQEMYWHFMYDKYRDVYYRFALFACDVDARTDVMELDGVRQEFSVMVLGRDFKVIKEVRFPKDRYLPKMCFIGKKGLYISENNPANPDFDENKLVFSCFR